MQATEHATSRGELEAQERLEDELAALTAHINAATARWLELVWAVQQDGVVDGDLAPWVAFRCGISSREAREYVRVAETLRELPATRAAFGRGELTFTKVRALTRVATPASEEALLELAGTLTASQLERALRAFRRLRSEDARETHELEYVDYHWGEDGSLFLRARLPAEDGTLAVRALDATRERVRARRREAEAAGAGDEGGAARAFEAPRSVHVEALVEPAETALAAGDGLSPERGRLAVHVARPRSRRAGPGDQSSSKGLLSPSRRRCDWAATPRQSRSSSGTASR